MAKTERLLVLKNTGAEPITDIWDGHQYTFAAGEEVSLVFGVGVHFKEHHPELVVVEEKEGYAPHVVATELTLLNPGHDAVDLLWDGHPYHFEPGATAKLDADIATALITQARGTGKTLTIAGTSEPEVVMGTTSLDAPSEPKPKAKRSKKAAE